MTRYPKKGKGNKWTELELKNIPLDWVKDTLNDTGGLSGQVKLTKFNVITISFKYAFKLTGSKKVNWFYCGAYPNKSIAEIRQIRDEAKYDLKIGIDPRLSKKTKRIEAQNKITSILNTENQKLLQTKLEEQNNLTFENLYNVWISDGVNRGDGNKYLKQSLSKHALPALGHLKIRELNETHLLNLYRNVIKAGKIPTAVELSKDIKQMLKWGHLRKPWRNLLVDGNPSELVNIKVLIPAGYTKERKRVLSEIEIKKLHVIFEEMTRVYDDAEHKYGVERPLNKKTQIAMWISLGSLCRIGELIKSEWADVDFENGIWFIPAENVKGTATTKQSQVVYLSPFLIEKFRQLHSITGDGKWLFPNKKNSGHLDVKSPSKQIGDRQIKFKNRTKKFDFRVENNSLVVGEEDWTPHDMRRTGATMMQKLKIHRDVINLCQNHVIGTKVDRVYLLDDYAEEKKAAWLALGNKLNQVIFT